MHPARFIWDEPTGEGRNLFRRFQLDIELNAPATQAVLNLFADSRYRLFVNETFIGAGPARFVPSHPEYDSHDIATHLKTGPNTIRVEVNSLGTTSFQTARDSIGGFIAWGEVLEEKTARLATPGTWQVQKMNAWDANAPDFTFALGPAEIVDTRKPETTDLRKPALIKNPVWGSLEPRSVPGPTLEIMTPDKTVGIYDLSDAEQIIGFRQHDTEFGPNRYTAYAAWIHSACKQTTEIGIFWGNHYLNGAPLEGCDDPLRGNRLNAELDLNEGWNLLYGEVEQLKEIWGLLIGIPRDAGLTIRAEPDLNCTDGLLYSNPLQPENCPSQQGKIPPDEKSFQTLELFWSRMPADTEPLMPARIRAWDIPVGTPPENSPLRTGARTWVYEFEKEFDGFIKVEINAPEGTTLDIGVDDWLRKDGLIHLYATNPYVNTVDRYILRGGKQTVQGFHVRGGHYLELTLALPDGAEAEASINQVEVLSANSDFPNLGNFECSDPVLNWAYQTAARTLQVSTEDSYADCPWRERGTYLGDGYVNIHMHEMMNSDLRIPKRFLRLFAQSQFANGQMPSAAPSWMTTALEDYTLIWILALYDYQALTQDTALVEELWPVLENILNSSSWVADETGLWDADHLTLFIDWGVLESERLGKANGCLNALRIRALTCAAELANLLGKTKQAKIWNTERLVALDAFSKHLWIESENRFAASLKADGSPADTPALHANILAALYWIGTNEQQTATCRYVVERLKTNAHAAIKDGQHSGHAEYYFLFFALEMLYQRGYVAEAEQIIRDHYRPMMETNSGTLWECLCRGIHGWGSRCHSWGGEPLVSALRYTLGIQLPDPKNPNKVRIAPQAETIDWAKGTYPHPKGNIHVEWKRIDGKIELKVSAPDGIEISEA